MDQNPDNVLTLRDKGIALLLEANSQLPVTSTSTTTLKDPNLYTLFLKGLGAQLLNSKGALSDRVFRCGQCSVYCK